MSEINPKNLKVAELRDELKARGLQTVGKKDVLVKRLEAALAGEEPPPQTTSDLDASQTEEETSLSEEKATEDSKCPEPETKDIPEQESEKVEADQSGDNTKSESVPEEEEAPQAPEPEPEVQPEPEVTEQNGEDHMETNEVDDKPEDEKEEKDEDQPEDDQNKNEGNDEIAEFQVMDQVGEDDATEVDQHKRGEKRKRSRSRSRSREKHRDRHHRRSPTPKVEMESDEWLQAENCQLDRYNCDLNIRISENGLRGTPISVEGFALMWAGVRGTYGVNKGKICYQVKILDNLDVKHITDEENKHIVRVGWSTDSCSLQLGEEEASYGYDGTAKKCEDCKFHDFGHNFGKDDVITTYIDFDVSPPTISYAKNGDDLGIAFEVDAKILEKESFFPHILSKNCEFEVNFGEIDDPWFPVKEGFTLITKLDRENLVRGSLPPENKENCEMMMMCGLPGSGKTVWAKNYASENKDKKYNLLGTHTIIDKMKVMGLSRKQNYTGRWDTLIDKSTKCLNRLLEIAARKKRNYILDQTNVYASARKRKMRPFEGFQRKAIVVVPTDEDFKSRCEKRDKEENKEIPDSAVLEMKANFSLPQDGDLFEEIQFVELNREDAQKLIDRYNKEAKSQLPPPDSRRFRSRDNRRDNRSGRDRRDYNRRDFNRQNRDRYRNFDRRGRDDRRGGYRGGGGYGGGGGGRGGWGSQGGWGGGGGGGSGGGSGGWQSGGYGGGSHWGGGGPQPGNWGNQWGPNPQGSWSHQGGNWGSSGGSGGGGGGGGQWNQGGWNQGRGGWSGQGNWRDGRR